MDKDTLPTITIHDGRLVTTSLDVAEKFGKLHKNVLQAIAGLECSQEFAGLNFQLSEYQDSTGRTLPMSIMTKDGFSFLAMGFTGKEAARWKEAYIVAFNRMEAKLESPRRERVTRQGGRYDGMPVEVQGIFGFINRAEGRK